MKSDSFNLHKVLHQQFHGHSFTSGTISSDAEIDRKEKDLGKKLPFAYRKFLQTYGAASFFGVNIFSPSELYEFDETVGSMEGYIPFALDSYGNYFAFKPQKGAIEYEVFRCCHDPFGSVKVADSFAAWTNLHVDLAVKGETDYHSFPIIRESSTEKRTKTQPKKVVHNSHTSLVPSGANHAFMMLALFIALIVFIVIYVANFFTSQMK